MYRLANKFMTFDKIQADHGFFKEFSRNFVSLFKKI
jgi:hypothetical protein